LKDSNPTTYCWKAWGENKMSEVGLIDHLPQLESWLRTFPISGLFNIQNLIGQLDFIRFDPSAQSSTNMLKHVATNSTMQRDIMGIITREYTVDYLLYLRRDSNTSFSRQEINIMLTQLPQWSDIEHAYDRQPKFGNIATDIEEIRIYGGTGWASVESMPWLEDYMHSLQLNYKIMF